MINRIKYLYYRYQYKRFLNKEIVDKTQQKYWYYWNKCHELGKGDEVRRMMLIAIKKR